MSLGLVAKKCGMTRIFQEDGTSIPVSVLAVDPNRVTQVKTIDTDGYCAVQVTVGEKKSKRVNQAMAGHFAKAGTPAGMKTCEFRLTEAEFGEFNVGSEQVTEGDEDGGNSGSDTKSLTVDIFNAGDFVDVAGTTKGKGFAGVVKRHNFRTQDATHGNSLSHRAHGSTGQCQTPGRVFKGKKMAGQMGNKTRSTQNLEIVRVDNERNLLLVKGSVPGAAGGYVFVKPAVKKQRG